MASPAPSRPTPREPDRRRCRRPPPTPQLQVAHPPGEPPNSSFLSPSRQFPPIRRHRAIIQLPDLGSVLALSARESWGSADSRRSLNRGRSAQSDPSRSLNFAFGTALLAPL